MSHLANLVKKTINELLGDELLREILSEVAKHDVWKSNAQRGLVKSRQSKPVNRDQLISFLYAERGRLTEAAVHIQYVFLPKLLNPNQDSQMPFVSLPSQNSVLMESEKRIEREFNKLNEWILKRDELRKRFNEYLANTKAKIPVHKQDHEPVRRCPNPRCGGIALFKHTPDSLVCVQCGMSQRYLDNNIAYGEEVEWSDSKSRNKVAVIEGDLVTVKDLILMPYLLKNMHKKFDLSTMLHYNVIAPTPLSTCRDMLTRDMLQYIQSIQYQFQQWSSKPSSELLIKATSLWKQFLKKAQFSHPPTFVFVGVCVILQWTPPPVPEDVHKDLSQTLYLFDTALNELQTSNPDGPLSSIRGSNFRKYALLQILQMKRVAPHLALFISLSKHDKLNRAYDGAFRTICHYIQNVQGSVSMGSSK